MQLMAVGSSGRMLPLALALATLQSALLASCEANGGRSSVGAGAAGSGGGAGAPVVGVAGGGPNVAGQGDDARPSPHPLMGRPGYWRPLYPSENPHADDKALLGKILFWEEQLSADGSTACGTCHRGSAGGSDPRAATDAARLPGLDGLLESQPGPTSDDARGALGIIACSADGRRHGVSAQVTPRKPPSAFDAMFNGELFWDGRAGRDFRDPETRAVLVAGMLDRQSGRIVGGALESQAAGPFLSDVEMSCASPTWSAIYDRLARVRPLALASAIPADMQRFIDEHGASYPLMFARVFGPSLKQRPSDPHTVINASRMVFAIATYERLLTSNQTPWDRWNAGDPSALTPLQVRGFELFMGAGNCQACHSPPLFMDLSFHYLGFHRVEHDHGRGGVAGNPATALGQMKTPSLRNVGLREAGGLLHQGDGPGRDLMTVMRLYNEGGRRSDANLGAEIDPLLVPLSLSEGDLDAIIAFLRHGLTDPRVVLEVPPFDRPRLQTER